MPESVYVNNNVNQLRISLLAPSGYGKSTASEYICRHYDAINLKLASPLYKIQEYYYHILGVATNNRQDGELLQFLGEKIQRDYPSFLADAFYHSLNSVDRCKTIVINDDCRPHNYPFLQDMGFIFVAINGFSRTRNDIKKVNSSLNIEWKPENIKTNYVLENAGSLQTFYENIRALLERIKYDSAKK